MVQQVGVSNRWLIDALDQLLASYQPEALHEKYNFPKLEVFMTAQWLNNECAKHVVNKVLKGWIAPGKTFRDPSKDGYKASIFFKHIHLLNALMF